MKELIKYYEDYIKLLSDEIDDLVSIAAVHRWSSDRVDEGERLRNKIRKQKKQVLSDLKPNISY